MEQKKLEELKQAVKKGRIIRSEPKGDMSTNELVNNINYLNKIAEDRYRIVNASDSTSAIDSLIQKAPPAKEYTPNTFDNIMVPLLTETLIGDLLKYFGMGQPTIPVEDTVYTEISKPGGVGHVGWLEKDGKLMKSPPKP